MSTEDNVAEGAGEVTDTSAEENASTEPEVTETTEETGGNGEAEQSTETPEEEGSEETPEGEENSEEGSQEEGEKPDYYFNGEKVSVEVPDDLKQSLDDVGVDVDQVLSELYGEESDFTLSEETRKPLDEKYGKAVVDTFLGAIKAQNEAVLQQTKEAQKAAEEANKQAVEWSNELVGGEENWTAMSDWAVENLSDEQLDSFNKAMDSGDKYIQELAIKDLKSKYHEAEGDTNATLISGDSTASVDSGSPLSSSEYIAEMTSPEFRALKGQEKVKAQAKLDARRRAGMKKGL